MADIMKNKEYFLKAVACVINDTELEKADGDIDSDLICRIAARNNVGTIIYFADKKNNFISAQAADKLERSYKASVVRELNQQTQLDLIRKDFKNNKIKFMILKGSHLKRLYPMSEMRFMVDMDILVHKEDIERAKEIILSYGLEFKMNNGKDLVFIKEPFLTIELHNSLFIESNPKYGYFTDVWDRAEQSDEYEYKMSDNDLYVYTLAHLLEHYTSAEACFRPVMDLYLLEKKLGGSLDFEYIEREIEKLRILKFYKKIRKLTKCMFEGAEKDGDLTVMENYIVLGPPVNNAAAAAKANRSKASRIFISAFPGLDHMKKLFPILEKYPFLLPVFWIIRLFKNVFKKETRGKLEAIQNTGMKEYDILQDIYRKSGID